MTYLVLLGSSLSPLISLSHRLEFFNQIIISLDLFESLQKVTNIVTIR
jgi:hypothetical protein